MDIQIPPPSMNILVIRMLSIMANAYSSQNMYVTAYGLENKQKSLGLENLSENLKIISQEFGHHKTLFENIRDIKELSKLIKNQKPSVIVVNALQDLFAVHTAVNLSTAKNNRPIVVAMAHNPLTWKSIRNAKIAATFIRLYTDGFICLSTTHQHLLVKLGVPEKKIVVIPNPLDLEQVKIMNQTCSHTLDRHNARIRIVYIASICERKAQDVLIRAASLVCKKYPNTIFDLVGQVYPGEEKYAKNISTLAYQLGVKNHVRFLGAVPYQDVMSVLLNSDILVYPTKAEMMPRGVIEAMMSGRPVIASAVDGILDLIDNRKTGILVQPDCVGELSNAICELIEDKDLANRLGTAGQKYVLDFCSPERIGKLFYDFCLSLNGSLAKKRGYQAEAEPRNRLSE